MIGGRGFLRFVLIAITKMDILYMLINNIKRRDLLCVEPQQNGYTEGRRERRKMERAETETETENRETDIDSKRKRETETHTHRDKERERERGV